MDLCQHKLRLDIAFINTAVESTHDFQKTCMDLGLQKILSTFCSLYFNTKVERLNLTQVIR
jgi:hypothetical protein